MVEAGLKSLGASWDRTRVDYALRQHEQWYKGDGAYGDGPEFHWDYYNSFVIHPMLTRRARRLQRRVAGVGGDAPSASSSARARYAAVQERLDRAGRQLPADRPLDRVPLRRLSPARAGGASPPAARRRVAGAGARRADRGHSTDARSAGHLRRGRLAADRLLRPPAGDRRDLHLDRQPVSLLGRLPAARPAGERSVLVGAAAAVDIGQGLVRSAVPDRSRAQQGPSGHPGTPRPTPASPAPHAAFPPVRVLPRHRALACTSGRSRLLLEIRSQSSRLP